MIKAEEFWVTLSDNGFRLFSGVPCSIFKEALNFVFKQKGLRYVSASREDIALGIASGAYLSGEKSAILLQNSGLGHIVNALTSFNMLYKIPVLMFISWRGYKGNDAPEHLIMGRKTVQLLDTLGIRHRMLTADFRRDIKWAVDEYEKKRQPVAILVREGLIK